MNKRIQKSQISIGLLMMCVIVIPALLFSSCKKKAPPVAYHIVTFNSQGGSAVSPITGVKQGSTITLPASPTKAGSTFDGWCTDKEGKSSFSPTTPIYSDLTLYAKWIEQFYTVTFDSQGGSAVNPITGVKYGSTITLPAEPTKADLPADPTKPDLNFCGWFIDDDTFKNQFDAKTPITANLTLYAKWTAFTLSSTSFSDGGIMPVKHYHEYLGHPEYQNISPQLSWANPPKGTKSFVIIMENPEAPGTRHWSVYNIPADKLSLAENDPWLSQAQGPPRSKGYSPHYWGPYPPYIDEPHDSVKGSMFYFFLFALDLPDNYFTHDSFPNCLADFRDKGLYAHVVKKRIFIKVKIY